MLSYSTNNYSDIISLQRPLSIRPSMEISHRSKQFAPFAALQGFENHIRLKGILYEEKKLLSDDRKAEIDYFLRDLSTGDEITVTFFVESNHLPGAGEYHTITGSVSHLEPHLSLRINDIEIKVVDIYDIKN